MIATNLTADELTQTSVRWHHAKDTLAEPSAAGHRAHTHRSLACTLTGPRLHTPLHGDGGDRWWHFGAAVCVFTTDTEGPPY